MPRYLVRDEHELRRRMERSQRVVPHSMRSLAALVDTTHGTIYFLVSGKQKSLDEELAKRIAVALGCPVKDLFMPEASTIVDVDNPEGIQSDE